MKKKYLIAFTLIAGTFIIADSTLNSAYTNTNGAPTGKTGSPGDGSNCTTSCHSGTATPQAGMITSTIPATGYVPGNTYTVSASVTVTGKIKFGCQVSPQKSNGQLHGSMALINSTNTKLVGAGKYITHTSAGTSGSGTKTWSFLWTAPVAGNGAVTFYGAFNASNNNNLASGDQITLSTLTAQEDLSGDIFDNVIQVIDLQLFPNPSQGNCFVSFTSKETTARLSVFDINGKNVYEKQIENIPFVENKIAIDSEPFTTGIYFISIRTEQEQFGGKLIRK